MIHQAGSGPSRNQLFHLLPAARVIPYQIVNGTAGGDMPAQLLEEIHRVFAERLILKKGKLCTVCTHRERAAIDLAVARGVAVSALARRYDLGTDSIYRHRRAHLAAQLRAKLIAGPDIEIDLYRVPLIRTRAPIDEFR